MEEILKLAQKCVEQVPVIVLGSGASAQHGIGGMGALQTHLLNHINPVSSVETESWAKFSAELARSSDLEAALHAVSLPSALETRVIRATREMVLSHDLAVLQRLVEAKEEFALSQLIKYLLRSVHKHVQIVTTNYDRIAEYACDAAEVPHFTGFLGGHFRTYQSAAEPRPAFGDAVVEILKVHGSVDWFMDPLQNVVALTDAVRIPSNLMPVMVTPGTGKYAATHDEPFRTIIARSDSAFAKARSILCVGYGFNDRHIQPKLINRIIRDKIPLVILARTLTPKARSFIAQCKHPQFLALEHTASGSIAYTSDNPAGIEIHAPLWEFKVFLEHVIGKQ